MSPKRPSSRRAAPSASTSKPYERTMPTSTNNVEDTGPTVQSDIALVDSIASKPGFPSYSQYRNIETNYLNSILPKRQGRALISQAMFDRIWHILQHPNSMAEDAQFRYWVRKMFTLGTLNDLNIAEVLDYQSPQAVMLHDGRIVAVREQIYEILCYSHGITKHGGRDKTFSSVRKHYSWVPKELVAQFTKACPTCLIKKCGLSKNAQADSVLGGDESSLPTLREFLCNMGKGTIAENQNIDQDSSASGHLSVPGPSASIHVGSLSDGLNDKYRSRIPGAPGLTISADTLLNRHLNRSEPCEILMNPRVGPEPLRRAKTGLESLPMSREVSLYQGLPNGWQFRTDYATAHAEFIERQGDSPPSISVALARKPRIPSVAPMKNFDSDSDTDRDRELSFRQSIGSPPMEAFSEDILPSVIPSPHSYVPQIDPALLARRPLGDPEQDPLQGVILNYQYTSSTSLYEKLAPQPHVAPSIHRRIIPPPINIQSLSSQKTIETFLAHRATEGISPDSPAVCSTDSPTSSAGSYSSGLSAFPMTATSSVSPANSVLPTPTDESVQKKGGDLGKELIETAGSVHLNASVEAVCNGVV